MDLQAKKVALEAEIGKTEQLSKEAKEQIKIWQNNAAVYETQMFGLKQKLDLLDELIKETAKIEDFKDRKQEKEKPQVVENKERGA